MMGTIFVLYLVSVVIASVVHYIVWDEEVYRKWDFWTAQGIIVIWPVALLIKLSISIVKGLYLTITG